MSTRRRALVVKICRLPHAAGLPLPAYQSDAAAGMDLLAAIPANAPIVLQPMARALIPTGLSIELPPGTEAQVRPRSGLAAKHGLTVLNSPGTIDADYRGEVSVILVNLGEAAFHVARGDRIAQLVLAPVVQAKLVETGQLSDTMRGGGGFGSTGTNVKNVSKNKSKKKPIAPAQPTAKFRSPKQPPRKRTAPSQR